MKELTDSELMIGNYYVGYDGNIHQIDLQFFINLGNGVDIDEMIKQPLIISNQFLAANGFSLDADCNEYTYNEGCEFTIGRESASDLWFVYQINIDGFLFFKYVHQLQNILFLTTGKKLNNIGGRP